MGALHATSIVVALRDRRARGPIIVFGLSALCFITLAALWASTTPIMGLWGSIVWFPITAFLPPSLHNLIFVLITGSAIGCSGYWVLVRWFWVKSLRRVDLLRTVTLCVAATLLVTGISEVVPSSVTLMRPELWGGVFDVLQTVAWWFAFSISLYWSEVIWCAHKPTEAMNGCTPMK
jgi:hypothetical protein